MCSCLQTLLSVQVSRAPASIDSDMAMQGRSSELWPFLETLPADHDCLLAWSQEEAAELKGAQAHTSHLLVY